MESGGGGGGERSRDNEMLFVSVHALYVVSCMELSLSSSMASSLSPSLLVTSKTITLIDNFIGFIAGWVGVRQSIAKFDVTH